MPRHAAVHIPLWDALMAYVTLVVAYLSMTVRTGRHVLGASSGRRAEFGADEQWPDELRSMKQSMAGTQVIPVQGEDAWSEADVLFERTQDASDGGWPMWDPDREEVDA